MVGGDTEKWGWGWGTQRELGTVGEWLLVWFGPVSRLMSFLIKPFVVIGLRTSLHRQAKQVPLSILLKKLNLFLKKKGGRVSSSWAWVVYSVFETHPACVTELSCCSLSCRGN
jgi:hypothetical protein